MKNLFFALSVLCLISCANNFEESQSIIEKNGINEIVTFEDVDELPDISILAPFVSSIEIDESRSSEIDTVNSILKIPVSVEPLANTQHVYFKWPIIKIARYNYKPGCIHCVDCIGFRYKPNKPTPISIINLSKFNDVLDSKFRLNQLSVHREQEFMVKIDYNNQVLEFHSNKLIDWEKLM